MDAADRQRNTGSQLETDVAACRGTCTSWEVVATDHSCLYVMMMMTYVVNESKQWLLSPYLESKLSASFLPPISSLSAFPLLNSPVSFSSLSPLNTLFFSFPFFHNIFPVLYPVIFIFNFSLPFWLPIKK